MQGRFAQSVDPEAVRVASRERPDHGGDGAQRQDVGTDRLERRARDARGLGSAPRRIVALARGPEEIPQTATAIVPSATEAV